MSDLKEPEQTFRDAYNDFLHNASYDTHRIVRNVQFFHECGEHARRRQQLMQPVDESVPTTAWSNMEEHPDGPPQHDDISDIDFENFVTEDDIQRVLDQPHSPREQMFADVAINIALKSGALQTPNSNHTSCAGAPLATEHDLEKFQRWQAVLDGERLREDEEEMFDSTEEVHPLLHPLNDSVTDLDPSTSCLTRNTPPIEEQEYSLNERQLMVHRIVANHLRDHLANKSPPQRLMIIQGPGGTGKTTLLNAISKTFESEAASHLLAKTAMSGVAATIIGGQTLHSWATLPIKPPHSDRWITHPTRRTDACRKKNMQGLWLTVDEMSMLTTPLLLYLSRAAGMVRTGLATVEPSVLFGGLNVILLGDLHQLPPIAKSKQELYYPNAEDDDSHLGRSYFEQFNVVIKLEEQNHIKDTLWNNILHRSRTGDCTTSDIEVIKKLRLTDPACDIPDFSCPPWSEAFLVTSRNAVCEAWNELKITEHSHNHEYTKYIVYADDQCDGKPLTKCQRLATAHITSDVTNTFPHKIEIVKGMKAMVLLNISTDADLANGTRGIVEDIILDPREERHTSSSPITLRYLPAVILFKPIFSHDLKFPGLPDNIVPIFPTQTRFKVGGNAGFSVERKQFALTPAYAFTDFKAQGQTIEHVIVDIAKPPSGKLDAFHAYVALSRSRGREMVRLLRDFDERLFTIHPSEHLRKEDDRLEILEKETMWRYNAGEFKHI